MCCNRRGVWTEHPHTSHFSRVLRACVMLSHTTLAQVFVRVIPPMCHAPVCLISLRPSLRTLHFSPIFYFILLIFHFIFYVDRFGAKPPVRFREWGVWPFGQQRSSHNQGVKTLLERVWRFENSARRRSQGQRQDEVQRGRWHNVKGGRIEEHLFGLARQGRVKALDGVWVVSCCRLWEGVLLVEMWWSWRVRCEAVLGVGVSQVVTVFLEFVVVVLVFFVMKCCGLRRRVIRSQCAPLSLSSCALKVWCNDCCFFLPQRLSRHIHIFRCASTSIPCEQAKIVGWRFIFSN